ncbi:MAG: hypothetical protein ACYDCL_00900 [Myxococcales bacterium]
MKPRIDLADPTFEPSGRELQELSHRAFAGVAEANERRLERLRAEIHKAREAALRRLDEAERSGRR